MRHRANGFVGSAIFVTLVAAPAYAGWSETGSMITPRSQFTAVLLQNGKVLVAGGFDSNSIVASAELYDPETGEWTETGSMNTARSNHTVTVLNDGRVLATGGFGIDYPWWLASVEIYDPETGEWTETGSLNTARDKHTATLLDDGRVLVTSGESFGIYLGSAELYDPNTGQWTETPGMPMLHYYAEAELLNDGRVLVAGGVVALFYNETYDPAMNAWTPNGNMRSTSRWGFTLQKLECDCPDDGKVLAAGGNNQMTAKIQDTAELFDPSTNTWSDTGSMRSPRYFAESDTLDDGRVLVVGGANADFEILASAEVYDPATQTWSDAGSMSTPRFYPQVVRLTTGKVLVMGGRGGLPDFAPLASTELYDAESATEVLP